jgi:3-hydroxybutyryl-CoA dehydratase
MGDSVSFSVGQSSSLRRTVTAVDVDAFARLTGDTNPLHLDDAFASGTRFGRRIAHGMLAASYVATLLGTKFPGPGTIYLGQTLTFSRPVFLDDTLEVSAVVTGYRAQRGIVTLKTTVCNDRGETVLSGEAVCLVADVAARPAVGREDAASSTAT